MSESALKVESEAHTQRGSRFATREVREGLTSHVVQRCNGALLENIQESKNRCLFCCVRKSDAERIGLAQERARSLASA